MENRRDLYERALLVLQELVRVSREARRGGEEDVADYLDEVAYRQRLKVQRLRGAAGVPA